MRLYYPETKRALKIYHWLLLAIIYLGIILAANAQTSPTYIDWVKPNQTYLEIKVGRDGVYRIPGSLVGQYFTNLPNLNPAGFQVFRRGREIPIRVSAGSDNVLNDNDFIDFVGFMNDATSELEMYQKPLPAINTYRSVYNDTAYYFLTYSTALDGKRVVDNGINNNSSIPFETYSWRKAFRFNYINYEMGRGLRSNVTFSSYFTAGEGWTGRESSVDFGDALVPGSFAFAGVSGIQNLFQGGPDAQLEILQFSRTDATHLCDVILNTNLTFLDSFSTRGRNSVLFRKSFSINLIQGNTLNLWVKPTGKANTANSYAMVRYPATFQMPNGFVNQRFELNVNPNNYSRIRFENIGNIPELYDITEPEKPIRVGVGFVAGVYLAGVENTSQGRELMVQNQPFTVTSSSVAPATFRFFNPLQFDYVIISHSRLRKPALGYSDPVEAYADFRSSPEGGNYKVLILEMDEVYRRFGYGDRNPLAVRNVAGFFVQKSAKPKALFLIGKGLAVNLRTNPFFYSENLVPTFGAPASDNTFTVGLGEPERTISFPVGRLAASTPNQVAIYLNKIREHEAFRYDHLWKKNVFHISGGLNSLEQTAFTNIMRNEVTSRVTDKFFGARVGHFNKSTSAVIEYVDMRKVLNAGISVLTLFGHSSQNSPDVEIGRASDPTQGFVNKGRYPLVIVNGCFTGNIYDGNYSLNEDWIFTPDKGAIMFWAAADEGLSALLRRHINLFYEIAFQDSAFFGKTFGEIQKETMRRYMSNLSSEPQLDSSFMHQFVLHGDPVLKVFGGFKPDYKTSNAEVFVAQNNLSATSPNLRLGVVVSNFGRYNGDSLEVRITRRYSTGQTSIYTFLTKPIPNLDTLYFDLPQNEQFVYSGTNRIEVMLDFLNKVSELNESNNIAVVEFFVPAASILPLYPKKYAIVGTRNVRLSVQATDFFAPGRRYIFQVDTSAFFNSSLFLQSPPILAGNLCTWNYQMPIDRDSTVFFWRVRFADQTNISDTTWFNMTFEYIKNSPGGWAQSHFYQFRESKEERLKKNFSKRNWEFPPISTEVELKVAGGSLSSSRFFSCTLDGISVMNGTAGSSNCYLKGFPRLCAITFDRCDLKPKFWNYSGDPIGYYGTGCGRLPFAVNIFAFIPEYNTMRFYFQSYIDQFVQEGDYVLLFPVDSIRADSVKKYASDVISKIGLPSDSLAKIKNGNPFIIFGQKNSQGNGLPATFIFPQNNGVPFNKQDLTFRRILTSACATGSITSTKIGPASAWFELFNRFTDLNPPDDKVSLSIKGIRLDGSDSVLVKEVPGFPYSLSAISADSFPFLELKATTKDSANFTPATLKRWMVTYDGVPEGIINTSEIPPGEYKRGELAEGDSIGYNFAFTNISDKAFADSVQVLFSLNNNKNQYMKLPKIVPSQTVKFSYSKISTIGKGGNNNLLCFVNPRLLPEEYYENNALNLNFKVREDNIQPVLDVTFDGVKIMNGDFVSNTPLVAISLKDENKFLIKSDTSGMLLLLTRPCTGCVPERIPFGSPQIKVFPAGKDNLFRIEYRPDRLENGNYRLAVQGSDVKGNASGSNLYQIDFQVLDQKTITHFYPYPNPFSTSCQWVFTVTGEIPGDFKIQIMTIGGRVVREIMSGELGPLRIGNNVSTYRWDGTDEFGDRLANGVYLYRVVMKDPSTFAARETAADHTFTKGYGKLYIIR
jgi:hypothetical protein